MKLYETVKEIKIETPELIDFKGKVFHLSGDFSPSKKDFGTKLEEIGAKYRGLKNDPNHQDHLNLKEIDFLVLADNGITHSGEKKDYGNKAKRVQAHNDKSGQSRHISIITESHCKKLIDGFSPRKETKP